MHLARFSLVQVQFGSNNVAAKKGGNFSQFHRTQYSTVIYWSVIGMGPDTSSVILDLDKCQNLAKPASNQDKTILKCYYFEKVKGDLIWWKDMLEFLQGCSKAT